MMSNRALGLGGLMALVVSLGCSGPKLDPVKCFGYSISGFVVSGNIIIDGTTAHYASDEKNPTTKYWRLEHGTLYYNESTKSGVINWQSGARFQFQTDASGATTGTWFETSLNNYACTVQVASEWQKKTVIERATGFDAKMIDFIQAHPR